MSPIADPPLPAYARIILAGLVFALLAALVVAMAILAMGTHHPARTLAEMGGAGILVAIGAMWDRRRSGGRRPR